MTLTKSQKARKQLNRQQPVRKVRITVAKKPKAKKQKKGIMSTILPAAGGALGGLFGMPTLGTAVGTGLSRLFGSGDYNISSNSLMVGGVPTFSTLEGPVRFRHKELVTIPSTATNFTVSTLMALNPGVMTPILSQIATSFTMYKFLGLCFIYNPSSAVAVSSTNTALGVVGMVANYDPTAAAFTTRQAAEEYAGAQASVPSDKLILPVECKANSTAFEKRFVRTSNPVGKTLVETDLGTFQFFADGAQAASIAGEIWVAYDVEFYLPKVTYGGIAYQPDTFEANGTSSTNFAVAMSPQISRNVTIDTVNNRFQILSPGTYIIEATGQVNSTAVGNIAVSVYGTASLQTILPNAAAFIYTPEASQSSLVHGIVFAVSVTTGALATPSGFTLTSTFGSITAGVIVAHRISTAIITTVPTSIGPTVGVENLLQQTLCKNSELEGRLNRMELLLSRMSILPLEPDREERQDVPLAEEFELPKLVRQDGSPSYDEL